MSKMNEAYNTIGIETDVMSASGHRLIQLMINKCLQHIELAKTYIASKDVSSKSQTINKALNIIHYLRTCLNHEDERTKKLSAMLDDLYAYLQKNLLEANMNNDIACLEESKKVLNNIKEGWDGIAE